MLTSITNDDFKSQVFDRILLCFLVFSFEPHFTSPVERKKNLFSPWTGLQHIPMIPCDNSQAFHRVLSDWVRVSVSAHSRSLSPPAKRNARLWGREYYQPE